MEIDKNLNELNNKIEENTVKKEESNTTEKNLNEENTAKKEESNIKENLEPNNVLENENGSPNSELKNQEKDAKEEDSLNPQKKMEISEEVEVKEEPLNPNKELENQEKAEIKDNIQNSNSKADANCPDKVEKIEDNLNGINIINKEEGQSNKKKEDNPTILSGYTEKDNVPIISTEKYSQPQTLLNQQEEKEIENNQNSEVMNEINSTIELVKSNPQSYYSEISLYSSRKISSTLNTTIFKKNISNIKAKILSLEENTDEYQAMSCIIGAFMGDAIGSYCEFSSPDPTNADNVFVGNNIFDSIMGLVTDDSEMAMSMAYAIMDTPNIKYLDQNLIYYYYGLWARSGPSDMGNTTRNALTFFNKSFNIEEDNFSKFKKYIKSSNYYSLANGFLMRISPLVVWFYYINKNKVIEALNSNDNDNQLNLYLKIKKETLKDCETTHPNPETFVASAVFVYMGLCSIYFKNPDDVLSKLRLLLSNDYFKNKDEITVKKMILDSLASFEEDDFNLNEFAQGIVSQMGYYIHGFRITLYFLTRLKKMKNNDQFTVYRQMMNDICNFGGDTDTNAAICGCVLGPLIGVKNFGEGDCNIVLNAVPKNRFIYTCSIMYLYVKYLEQTVKLQKLDLPKVRFNTLRCILSLFEEEIDLDKFSFY